MRVPRPLLATALALAATATAVAGTAASAAGTGSGPAAPSSAPAAAPATAPVTWKACGPHGVQCASVQVPLDHRTPGGRRITIALARIPATDRAHRIGSLVFNPGGPGLSGIDVLPQAAASFSPQLRARFDIVTFDPRGVGRSRQVTCLSEQENAASYRVDLSPDGRGERAALTAFDRSLVATCRQRTPAWLLPHLSTADVARDLDRIRAATGDTKLTYLGFSYGTAIGATYAALFPGRLRAAVLDGATDPAEESRRPDLAALQQVDAFERALDGFFTWCRHHSSGCALGSDPRKAVLALSARLDAHPRTVTVQKQRVLINQNALLGLLSAAMGDDTSWPQVAQALTAAVHGDVSGLAPGAGGAYNPATATQLAVNCSEQAWPRSPSAIARVAQAAGRRSPLLGAWTVNFLAGPCAFWPVRAAAPFRGPFAAKGQPRTLVVGSTGDANTPYRWAQSLASQLSRATLLTRVGYGHTAYGKSGCIDRAVDAYLLRLTVPAAGTRCATDPGKRAP